MSDEGEDAQEGWHVCQTGWCAGIVDHLSCSLVNTHTPVLYNNHWGIIVSSDTRIECFFTSDSATWRRTMGGCHEVPACFEGHTLGSWGCAWSAETQLAQGLTYHMHKPATYNEFVVSAQYWESALPGIVEAIMCQTRCDRARVVHQSFLAVYGKTAADVPLLYYEPEAGGFTDISAESGRS